MVDEPTRVIASNIADNAPTSKTRADARFVSTRQENLTIESGDQYIVLDEMEKGELQSVRVVVDNPYVQVLLQLDEYRNKDPDGESAAEIIYNGNSDTANRGFKILDGQGSGKGYVMEYRPDVPEPYEQRVRLIIRNQIRRSGDVYGMDLSYTSGGSLANPAVPAHMAGGTFSHPALRSADMAQIAQAMTRPVGVEGYSSNQVFNEATLFSDQPLGSDHPYQGIAGKPFFKRDVSTDAIMEGSLLYQLGNEARPISLESFGYYRLRVIDEPDSFPGSSGNPSSMSIEIRPELQTIAGGGTHQNVYGFGVTPWYEPSLIRKSDLMAAGPFGDTWPGTGTYTPFTGGTSLTGETLPASQSLIGQRFFFRRGGTVYFPGVVKSVTKSISPIANTTASGAANVSSVSQTDGLGRFLDNNATNKLGTEDTFFAVGAHNQSSGNDIIVMPQFTATKLAALEGVKVAEGTADEITLTDTGDDELLKHRTSSSATGTYEVFHVPHTPWIYTIEFEPGVTESPIDFNVLFDDTDANPYLAGIAYGGSFLTQKVSTGKYANASNASDGTGAEFSRGLFPASETNCWGTVTSQADTNPHVLIKEIEVKRSKKVSYDG